MREYKFFHADRGGHLNEGAIITEYVRQNVPDFAKRLSRLSSFFAALSIDDALLFAKEIIPRPDHPVNIYEVFSEDFLTLDSSWLDYDANPTKRIEYAKYYWWGEITNHKPLHGERRPPRLEVLLSTPVRVGKVVETLPPDQ
ncbi:hypothetical protein [Photorhabdus temperata]|uniref:Uncharacterized protein n=2 Tax=Photorhabdus TaxID=29487 RepID=A0A081RXH7_PHOTE|nr:hypothetical protein [Photorhabdus temperata]KER03380.1 hypothetical protein MEG1DRAFT_01855 [Photorhabdus temperata subsp. temperata Meg1]